MKTIQNDRFDIYNENGKLIGQDYKRENGGWMHKWMTKEGVFERGSWRGRAEGENKNKWKYEPITI